MISRAAGRAAAAPVAAALAVALAAGVGVLGPGLAQAAPRWYAIPNVAFDTDDGLGFGVRGEVAFDGPGCVPYCSAWVMHLFATTRGYHHHRLRYDRTGLGPGGRLRVTAHLAWRQWLNDGYWGLGNRTARQREYVDVGDSDDPRRQRYRYTLLQPFLHVTLRALLRGPWSAFASANLKYSVVRTYDDSLLAAERPYGMDGGAAALGSVGLLYDTRHPELTPRRGVLAELSGRGTPPLPSGAGAFGGGFASLRSFHALGDRAVFAWRVMAEQLWGQLPFYEMVHWGGFVPVTGFGGSETLRGVSFGRWRAPGKAIFNSELRVDVLRHTLAGSPMLWQLVPYVDAGVVFGGDSGDSVQVEQVPVHPAAGLGLRAVYQEAFVGRIDTGFGLDPVVEPDGTVTPEATWGLYVVFDHTF